MSSSNGWKLSESQRLDFLPPVPIATATREYLGSPFTWMWLTMVILIVAASLGIVGMLSDGNQKLHRLRLSVELSTNHTQELRDEIVRLKRVIADQLAAKEGEPE